MAAFGYRQIPLVSMPETMHLSSQQLTSMGIRASSVALWTLGPTNIKRQPQSSPMPGANNTVYPQTVQQIHWRHPCGESCCCSFAFRRENLPHHLQLLWGRSTQLGIDPQKYHPAGIQSVKLMTLFWRKVQI